MGAQTCQTGGTFGACTCTGGSGGGSGGQGGGTGGGAGTGGSKRVFATSAAYNGNLGGLSGADAKCANSALAGNLGGSWKAWISDGTTNAIDRINDVGPWVIATGSQVVFNNKANLTTTPLINVGIDEQGRSLDGIVWTGTLSDGTRSTHTCQSWSGTTDVGEVGSSDSGNSSWTSDRMDGPAGCANPFHLYCLEQ
jgi:hypothetical protein